MCKPAGASNYTYSGLETDVDVKGVELLSRQEKDKLEENEGKNRQGLKIRYTLIEFRVVVVVVVVVQHEDEMREREKIDDRDYGRFEGNDICVHEIAGILPLLVACTKILYRQRGKLNEMSAYPSSAATKADRWCPRAYWSTS